MNRLKAKPAALYEAAAEPRNCWLKPLIQRLKSAARAVAAVAIIGGVLVGSSAFALEPARRVAFVVGNSAYKSVPALKNPLHDARAVADALRTSGFDVHSALDLNRQDFDKELRQFISSLNGAEVALFYYSGHGMQVGDDNRLIPIDAALKTSIDLEIETISMRTILGYMQSSSQKQLIFLDSCRNNPFPAKMFYVGERLADVSGTSGLASQQASAGSLIAYSTQPGNVAVDGAGQFSPFTRSFLKHGFEPGSDLQSALMLVTKDVSQSTNGRQVPWNNSSLTEKIVLALPPISEPAQPTQAAAQQSNDNTSLPSTAKPSSESDLAKNIAGLLGEAMDKPKSVPIGVGAIAFLSDFPLLRGQPGVSVKLVRGPSPGVLYLDNQPFTEGSLLQPASLRELRYEPSVGSERSAVEIQWSVLDNVGSAEILIGGKLAPYVTECDLTAAEPLDLQGVVPGKLPNEIDATAAVPACQGALSQFADNGRFKYQLGRALLAAKDVAGAMTLFHEAAVKGHIRAYYQLGYMAMRGVGRDQDLAEANGYFQRGAEQGDPYAMTAYGRNLVQGRGTPPDVDLGVKYLNRAVELGHTYAMNELGSMYYFGRGVKKNPERGVRFFMAGLERNDIYSANNLGIAYFEGTGVAPDATTALHLFKHASEGGHPFAPNYIGRMYFSGTGVKKNVSEAIKWYNLGAERGDSWAASNLGWVYSNGPKNLVDVDLSAWNYGLAVALDPLGQNPDALARLRAFPDKVKARLIKKLVAESAIADPPIGATLDDTIVLLQRNEWQKRNPRQDLF